MQYSSKSFSKYTKSFPLLLIITALIFIGAYFTEDNKTTLEKKKSLAVVKTESKQNDALPNLCEYEIDDVEDTAYQNCLNLYNAQNRFLLVEFSFFSEAKFGKLELIDQDDEVIPSRIVNSSIRAFELEGYTEPCKNYCVPSRLVVQFEIEDNVQVKGFRASDFIFREDVKVLEVIGFDPSELRLKAVYADEEMNDYLEIRKKLNESPTSDIVVDKSYKTPSETKPSGLGAIDPDGIVMNLDFIDFSNKNEKRIYNQKFHSTTYSTCLERIVRSKVTPFDVEEVCSYLVNQYKIANEFGDGKFSVPLHEAKLPVGPSKVELDPSNTTFFETLLTRTPSVWINLNKSEDLKDFQASALRAAYWISPNSVIREFKYSGEGVTEQFFVDFFKGNKRTNMDELDLSNNNIIFTSLSRALFNSFRTSSLNLSNNTITDSFIFQTENGYILRLDIRNTGWKQAKESSLWTNLPFLQEIKVTGTGVEDITLEQFINLLPNKRRITLMEGKFSDNDDLGFDDFQKAFPRLETLNTPLTILRIEDVNAFERNISLLNGDFGLPINNLTFGIVKVEDVYRVSQFLGDRIKDLDGNTVSLFFDGYLPYFFREFLKTQTFFQNEQAKELIEETSKEVFGSQKQLFDTANLNTPPTESIITKTERTQQQYQKIAKIMESKIVGKIVSGYIEKNNEAIEQYGLDNIPGQESTSSIIEISVLITLLISTTALIALLVVLRFRKKD